MIKTFLVVLCVSAAATAQFEINQFSILDHYYGDVLFKGNETELLSNKISYPGLLPDSTSSAGAGFYNPETYVSVDGTDLNPTLSWNNLYGWDEWNIGSGRIGAWLGGINAFENNNQSTSSVNTRNRYFSGNSALWFIPKKNSAFKGLSLTIYGVSSFSRNNSTSLNDYQYSTYTNESTNKNIDIAATSIVKINDIFHLRFFLDFSDLEYVNKNYGSYFSTYDGDFGSSWTTMGTSSKSINFLCGLIDSNERTLSLGISCIGGKSDYGLANGGINTFLRFSQGKRVNYQRHSLFIGIQAQARIFFPTDSMTEVLFSDIPGRVHADKRYAAGALQSPLILDINLFNSSLFAIMRIVPEIVGGQIKNVYTTISSHNVGLGMNEFSLGLRGKIGDQLEFALIPSLKSDIFVTGLEIKYNFKAKKSISQPEQTAGTIEEKGLSK